MTDDTHAALKTGRRAFLAGAAALAAAACSDGSGGGGGGPGRHRGGLALKGVNFDTERELWRPEYVRREIRAVRDRLHANAILLLGSDLGRLTGTAAMAADEGLHVWFEPRAFDEDARTTLEFVAGVARAAEDLRAGHPGVGLSVGCELTSFLHGLVPGDDWFERGTRFAEAGPAEAATYNRRLNAFLADALDTVRPVFGGRVTYTSEAGEDVDWRGFDVLGVDLYRNAGNTATYAEQVRRLHRHGKPVVITEFGCCAYRGAEDKGGMGFDVIDLETGRIVGDPVRDEQVQADYVDELLGIYETEGVHGAFVYEFISSGSPYSPDPRRDYDMAGFSVVKVFPAGHELAYGTTGHFAPKKAFHAIARHYR
ncbi:abortive infection protein [Streptomyces sp. NPDC004134]|uniref:abortive infection protein n=1 Tax=Streptomyces sp. NPDC004134 TaxID=3364691 RepID=UPI00368D8BE6